jgi:hypothetical protein
MSTTMERLAIELLGLPAPSRALLAKQLIASLPDDEAYRTAEQWLAVAKQRAEELIRGKVQGVPAEEVFRELEQELG